jgi:hypothetical protein
MDDRSNCVVAPGWRWRKRQSGETYEPVAAGPRPAEWIE